MNIHIVEREITREEIDIIHNGFDECAIDKGVLVQDSERIECAALDGSELVGAVSGLAYKNGDVFSGWFYLTDLFVKKEYRFQGVGSVLLSTLEGKLIEIGIARIWTWTAGYEAPGFYKKHGYQVFAEFENWYSNGDSRIGLRKDLA